MQLPTNHRHRKRSVTHSENIEWTMKQTETRVLSSSSLFVFSSGLKIIKIAAIEFLLVDLVYKFVFKSKNLFLIGRFYFSEKRPNKK